MFTFILAQYAVGLLIYWTWSSLITILQQYVMMRRFKVENPIDNFLARFSAKAQDRGERTAKRRLRRRRRWRRRGCSSRASATS